MARKKTLFDHLSNADPGGFAGVHKQVVPTDTPDIDDIYREFIVVVGGDVAIEDLYGNVEVYPAMPDYARLPVAGSVRATDTTATHIKGLR